MRLPAQITALFSLLLLIIAAPVHAEYKITNTLTTPSETASTPSQGCMININGSPGCNLQQSKTITNTYATPGWVDYEADNSKAGGNPLNLLTGNKFESAADHIDNTGAYALNISRYYNSKSVQIGIFGMGWRSDYEMQLQDSSDTIYVLQTDGKRLIFHKTNDPHTADSDLLVTRYKSPKTELGYLERTHSSDRRKPAWKWHLPNGKQIHFIVHQKVSTTNKDGHYQYGQLSRIIEDNNDPSSPYWSLTYDVKGNIAKVQNHQGDTLSFIYQTRKNGIRKLRVTKTTSKDRSSQTWHYLLDKKGNLAQVVNPSGNRIGYRYTDPNDPHNLTAKYSYDEHGTITHTTKWTYDAYDRAISSESQDGVDKITVDYDPDSLRPMPADHVFTNLITNSMGETTKYTYRFRNGRDELLSIIGAGCSTCGEPNVSYEYDEAGRVISITKLDDKGNAISSNQTLYDDLGRVVKVTQTNGEGVQAWRRYQYDNAAYPMQPTLVTRPSVVAGKTAQVKLGYDARGNVTSMTEVGFRPSTANSGVSELKRHTQYRYDIINGKSLLTAVDGPLEGSKDTTRYHYNQDGQLISIRYPEGLTQQMSYDKQGRIVSLKDVDGTIITYQYDAKGRVTQTNQNGQTTTISYDPMGRIAQITDPLGQILSYQYNAAGQLISMGDNTQAQIDLIRDKEGNLTAANLLVDGKVEQQEKYDHSDKQKDENEYKDIEYELLKTQQLFDKDNNTTTAYYDDFGRVVAEDSPTTGWTHYQWDNEDNLTKVINPLGQSITIKYDAFGRKTKIITNDDQVTLVWGSFNKLSSVINKDYQVNYTYDDYGNLNQKIWRFNDKTLSAKYKHNENHQVSRIEYPSGLTLNYVYDDKGQLAQITQKSWLKDKLLISNINDPNTYDNESLFNFGNGSSQTQAYRDDDVIEWAGNKNIAYSYSEPYQNGYAIAYSYPNLNISTSSEITTNTPTQIINIHSSITPSKGVAQNTTTQDQYNDIGQLIAEEGYQYDYDDLGRLIQVSNNERPIATYDYLITGERYKKTVIDINNQEHTTYYLYDNGILVSEFTQIETDANSHYTDYLYLGNRPAIQFNDQNPYYLTTDHRTAVIAATDDDANVVWQAQLNDNGQAQIFDNAQVKVNLRGSNQYYDSESGLHYNIHRYFSPTRNQYLSPDPMGLAAGEDLYAFANDRPHEFVDWWGLNPVPEPYEAVPGHVKVPNPRGFGTMIHQLYASTLSLRNLNGSQSWGGGSSRFIQGGHWQNIPTWPTGKGGMMPDAWYVSVAARDREDNGEGFLGEVYELKPATYKRTESKYKYKNTLKQIERYIGGAGRGTWFAGPCDKAVIPLQRVPWQKQWYIVTFEKDKTNLNELKQIYRSDSTLNKILQERDGELQSSGLIFYSAKKEAKKNTQNVTEKEVATAVAGSAALAKLIADIKKALKEAGWQQIAIAGIVIMLVVAIIAAILLGASIPSLISALLASIAVALKYIIAAAAIGIASMTAAMADVFGFNESNLEEDAKKEEQNKDKGMFGRWYDKFKNWLD